MNIKKIADLPLQQAQTESTNVLIEEGGAAKRIPANLLVPKVELPEDLLHYGKQELTEEQKAQARANIGAGVPVELPEAQKAVLYDQEQELEEEDKARARANIGAVSAEEIPQVTTAANQQLVTNGSGVTEWVDRLAYDYVEEVTLIEADDALSGLSENGYDYSGSIEAKDFEEFVPGETYHYKVEAGDYTREGDVVASSNKSIDVPCYTRYDEWYDLEIKGNVNTKKYDTVHPISYPPATNKWTIERISHHKKQLDEKFIPELSGVVVKSSTEGSTKKFRITVDDSGTISATEV